MKKICSKCQIEKDINDFPASKRGKYGKHSMCKECKNKNQKKWRKNNKKHVQGYKEKYRQTDKHKQYMKKYLESYKDRLHERNKQRRKNEPEYKLLDNLRSRLRAALKGTAKHESTKKLLGCTIEEFKIYLENKFELGMNWDNHGLFGWHIDHIIPCCKFKLSEKEDQKKCFHYSNMQPLWSFDNLSKKRKNWGT